MMKHYVRLACFVGGALFLSLIHILFLVRFS